MTAHVFAEDPSANELDEQVTAYFAGRSTYQTYAAYSVAELGTTGVETVAN